MRTFAPLVGAPVVLDLSLPKTTCVTENSRPRLVQSGSCVPALKR
jgi:hypothetical protein